MHKDSLFSDGLSDVNLSLLSFCLVEIILYLKSMSKFLHHFSCRGMRGGSVPTQYASCF